MKNSIFFLFISSLFFSSFAMDNGLSPAERRELLARAAEQRMRSQASETIESTVSQPALPVVQEEQSEGESDEHEIITMAERIEQDRKFTDSILNPKKQEEKVSKVLSLKRICANIFSQSYIHDDANNSYLMLDKLLKDLSFFPIELRKEIIVDALTNIYKKWDCQYLTIGSIESNSSDSFAFCYYLLEYAFLNYYRKIMTSDVVEPIELYEEAKLIFSTSYYQKLTIEEKNKLKTKLKGNFVRNKRIPFDLVKNIFNICTRAPVIPLQQLLLNRLIADVNIGFINIKKMFRLLDMLSYNLKIKLIETITDNKINNENELNFAICYECLKSILMCNRFKLYVIQEKRYNKNVYGFLNGWDYKKIRQEVAPIFASPYYKKLPTNLKKELKRGIMHFSIDRFGWEGYGAHFAENILSSPLYSIVNQKLYKYGCSTSFGLGLIGSFCGLALTSKLVTVAELNKFYKILGLSFGMLSGYRLATIPLYDWNYFFDYYDANTPGLPYDLCQLSSGIGAALGFLSYYFYSKYLSK